MSITTITLDAPGRAVLKKLGKIAPFARGAARQRLEKFLRVQAQRAAGHVIKTQLTGTGAKTTYQANPYTKKRRRRTGSLARSITGGLATEKGLPAIEVGIFRGPALKYAGIQEEGTKSFNPSSPFPDIEPKTAQALAIPVGDALTPAGVPRYHSIRAYPEQLKAIYFRSPRSTKGLDQIGVLVTMSSYLAAVGNDIGGLDYASINWEALNIVALLATRSGITPGFFLRDGVQDFLPELTDSLAAFMVKEVGG